jgi:pimeloyl-ACP methyl ester carboxylesterase
VKRSAAARRSGPGWRDLVVESGAVVRDGWRARQRPTALPDLPRGDGHPVLVIPALFSTDRMTAGFRTLLASLGYAVEGWNAGVNLGPTRSAWDAADRLLPDIHRRTGRKVSVIGHSLGGVFARALASGHPGLVRRVITVCSPFRPPVTSPLRPVYRVLARWHVAEEVLLPLLSEPPPVPTIAIYSPADRVVAWSSCIDEAGPLRENVAVKGAHSTMLGNPEAIRIIAERLCRD